MYTDIDSNGDGEIQFEEFLPWWKNYKENGSKIMDVEDAVPEIGASSQGLPKKPTEISTGENVDNKGSHQSLKQYKCGRGCAALQYVYSCSHIIP